MGQGEVVERLRPGLGCVLLLGDWARWYFSMYGRWAGSISPYARQCGGCRGVAVPPWYCAPMSEEAGVSCYCSVGLSSPTQGVERKTVGVNTTSFRADFHGPTDGPPGPGSCLLPAPRRPGTTWAPDVSAQSFPLPHFTVRQSVQLFPSDAFLTHCKLSLLLSSYLISDMMMRTAVFALLVAGALCLRLGRLERRLRRCRQPTLDQVLQRRLQCRHHCCSGQLRFEQTGRELE